MSTRSTGQRDCENAVEAMGVASMSSKRRLANSEANGEFPPAKVAKKTDAATFAESEAQEREETNNSDFLTTSILARTLLTNNNMSPLDSLKSSLEALPAPMPLTPSALLDSDDLRSTFLPTKMNLPPEELEFNSLICQERSLATVTILSPIDEETAEWKGPKAPLKPSIVSTTMSDQVITEEENGKSYFNLGTADTTLLLKKSYNNNNTVSRDDPSWVTNGDFDETSSSSCESISSEDLFNSGEEFDGSDDDEEEEEEEELHSYKQQRSTVLHISLCKLNMFRTQQCVEPSLHRSVLICNTLRHIEQEIKREDEKTESLETKETLPPFWPSSGSPMRTAEPPIPQIVERQQPPAVLHAHDPYLAPNLSVYGNEAPYSSYDYNLLRPNPTPFHTASYDYEQDLPSATSAHSLNDVSSPPAILECDSGYAEDLDLSSYYFSSPGPSARPEFPSPPISLPAAPPEPDSSSGGESNYLLCGYANMIEPSSPTPINIPPGPSLLLDDLSLQPPGTDISSVNVSTIVERTCEFAAEGSLIDMEPWVKGEGLMNGGNKQEPSSPAPVLQFAQQENHCGMESRRGIHCGSHHNLPMDSLISTNYSNSL